MGVSGITLEPELYLRAGSCSHVSGSRMDAASCEFQSFSGGCDHGLPKVTVGLTPAYFTRCLIVAPLERESVFFETSKYVKPTHLCSS